MDRHEQIGRETDRQTYTFPNSLILPNLHLWSDRLQPRFYYWVVQKSITFFLYDGSSKCLVVFNFIGNNFARLYCDSCRMSGHLKKHQNK